MSFPRSSRLWGSKRQEDDSTILSFLLRGLEPNRWFGVVKWRGKPHLPSRPRGSNPNSKPPTRGKLISAGKLGSNKTPLLNERNTLVVLEQFSFGSVAATLFFEGKLPNEARCMSKAVTRQGHTKRGPSCEAIVAMFIKQCAAFDCQTNRTEKTQHLFFHCLIFILPHIGILPHNT